MVGGVSRGRRRRRATLRGGARGAERRRGHGRGPRRRRSPRQRARRRGARELGGSVRAGGPWPGGERDPAAVEQRLVDLGREPLHELGHGPDAPQRLDGRLGDRAAQRSRVRGRSGAAGHGDARATLVRARGSERPERRRGAARVGRTLADLADAGRAGRASRRGGEGACGPAGRCCLSRAADGAARALAVRTVRAGRRGGARVGCGRDGHRDSSVSRARRRSWGGWWSVPGRSGCRPVG